MYFLLFKLNVLALKYVFKTETRQIIHLVFSFILVLSAAIARFQPLPVFCGFPNAATTKTVENFPADGTKNW